MSAVSFELHWSDLVDIIATATLIYSLLLLIRGTRAVQIMTGLLLLCMLLGVAQFLGLVVVATLLRVVLVGTAVTIPIVFQPELRRALESLGRAGIFGRPQRTRDEAEATAGRIASAAFELSRMRLGALIAIEVNSGLQDVIETGTSLRAYLSTELLVSIFSPKAPLHDGAVVIRDSEIVAASCVLPLLESRAMREGERRLGTRHRAALGLSEQTDAVVVTVSEESAQITVARNGKFSRVIEDEDRLRKILLACSRPIRERVTTGNIFARLRETFARLHRVERRA